MKSAFTHWANLETARDDELMERNGVDSNSARIVEEIFLALPSKGNIGE